MSPGYHYRANFKGVLQHLAMPHIYCYTTASNHNLQAHTEDNLTIIILGPTIDSACAPYGTNG